MYLVKIEMLGLLEKVVLHVQELMRKKLQEREIDMFKCSLETLTGLLKTFGVGKVEEVEHQIYRLMLLLEARA